MSARAQLKTEALAGPFGVCVDGLDLTRASDAEFDELVAQLYAHHILVIRGQDLSLEQYVAFGRRWGELVPYFQQRWTLPGTPEILLITNEAVPGRALPPAENWHADGTYLAQPHSATMLYGGEAPREGGETWFAGTALAYDALDEAARREVDGLMVKHVKNGGDRLALAEEHERALTLESQTTERSAPDLLQSPIRWCCIIP